MLLLQIRAFYLFFKQICKSQVKSRAGTLEQNRVINNVISNTCTFPTFQYANSIMNMFWTAKWIENKQIHDLFIQAYMDLIYSVKLHVNKVIADCRV